MKRCNNIRPLVSTTQVPLRGTAEGLLEFRIILSESGCVGQNSSIYKAATYE
jgi:hypothetical protein